MLPSPFCYLISLNPYMDSGTLHCISAPPAYKSVLPFLMVGREAPESQNLD